MTTAVYDIQGYSIVLTQIVFITRIFEAEDEQGYQFNIRFNADARLAPKFPTRNEAELARSLLVQALKDA